MLALETAEGVLLGALGTAVGVAVGLLVVRWVIATTVSSTMPEMGMDVAVSGGTVVAAVLLGVVAVAVAPLLTARRLRHMDVPGTLRVVE